MTKILLVCMANVCRSPIACVVARHLSQQQQAKSSGWLAVFRRQRLVFRSAGVSASLAGEVTDARAQSALQRRGYPVSKERSRRLQDKDFGHHDLILAMDLPVLAELKRQCPPAYQDRLHLFLDFAAPLKGTEIPDPYYGDMQGFEHVLDLCELGARALVQSLLCAPTGR